MAYTVKILPKAEKELRAIRPPYQQRIRSRIEALADDPRPPGYTAMKGAFSGYFRIRIGDYRVIYTIDDKAVLVTVVKVGQRGGVYG